MKGVTFNEQRRTEDRHLLLSSHSHTRARSLFVLAPNKSSFAGQKVSGAEAAAEKMRCAAAGARFYSASLSLSLALAKSEIESALFSRWGGQVWKSGSEKLGSTSFGEKPNDAFRGGNCFLSSNHHNGKCRNNFLHLLWVKLRSTRLSCALLATLFKWRFGSGGLCDGSGKQAPAVLRPLLCEKAYACWTSRVIKTATFYTIKGWKSGK